MKWMDSIGVVAVELADCHERNTSASCHDETSVTSQKIARELLQLAEC